MGVATQVGEKLGPTLLSSLMSKRGRRALARLGVSPTQKGDVEGGQPTGMTAILRGLAAFWGGRRPILRHNFQMAERANGPTGFGWAEYEKGGFAAKNVQWLFAWLSPHPSSWPANPAVLSPNIQKGSQRATPLVFLPLTLPPPIRLFRRSVPPVFQ